MPELPEVETVKRGLAPCIEGTIIEKVEVNRPNLRFDFPIEFATRLKGRKIKSIGRRAKYLLAELDGGETLIMHLGMSGSFRIEFEDTENVPGVFHHDKSKNEKHDHVVLHLKGKDHRCKVIYNDPRRFGFMDLIAHEDFEVHPYFKNLGIEPTGNQLNGDELARLFRDKKAPLKAALLDQRLIAGLGNIYVCEALHGAGLSPKRKAGSLILKSGKKGKYCDPLADEIRQVIAHAIKSGGSSLRDHRQTDGSLGYFQHNFRVYDREGADCGKAGCNGTIKRIVQSGRSTFYCPGCQR